MLFSSSLSPELCGIEEAEGKRQAGRQGRGSPPARAPTPRPGSGLIFCLPNLRCFMHARGEGSLCWLAIAVLQEVASISVKRPY